MFKFVQKFEEKKNTAMHIENTMSGILNEFSVNI